MANAAALLQGEGCFFQTIENAYHGIIKGTHDKAVEHCNAAPSASACHDAPGGQEPEI